MIFNSYEFLIFFGIFFILYWGVLNKSVRQQNNLLLFTCYIFYSLWDWRFTFLLLISSLATYWIAFQIHKAKAESHRQKFLILGMMLGIGTLAFFKYFNFFITSFTDLLSTLGFTYSIHTLNIILPIGISYYTFRILSYLIDVRNRKTNPCADLTVFLSYVAFFPSILSGPIDRAKGFISQLEEKRIFRYNQISDGLLQFIWGLFKKIVIADNCAQLTNQVFSDYNNLPGSSLLLGAFFFLIQLYADFSGYSDMAIGIARMIGIESTNNFNYPFFSKSIAEFWQRWHISLTSWMTDYIFTPLNIALRDYGKLGICISVVATFTIVGLWHGANWTFIFYGFLHGVYFIPQLLLGSGNKNKPSNKLIPSFRELSQMIVTFTIIMLTIVIIKSNNAKEAIDYYSILFSPSLFSPPAFFGKETILLILFLIVVEWIQRDKIHPLRIGFIANKYLRTLIYYVIVFIIISFGATSDNQFIYFKF